MQVMNENVIFLSNISVIFARNYFKRYGYGKMDFGRSSEYGQKLNFKVH